MNLPAELVAALGWALLDFLWQGLLVGAAAALALLALREARPQARYAVCCLALATCLLLPLAGVWRGMATATPAPAASASADAIAVVFASAPALRALPEDDAWRLSLQPQLPAIVAAWSAGALLLALRLALGCHWVGRLRAQGRLPSPHWQGRFDQLAVHVGLAAPVPLRVCDSIDSPVAAGWWRPVVLVPAALIAGMPADLLEALLAHELAHVRRRDYLVNLMQAAVEALLFYHPVVWWLSRRVRIEREQIADDLASNAIHEPRRLALALQALERFQSEPRISGPARTPGLVAAAHGGNLMSRIKRLMRPDPRRPDWKLALPLAALAACALALPAISATPRAVGTPAVAATPRVAAAPAVSVAPAVAALPAVAVTPQVTITPTVAAAHAVAVTPAIALTPNVALTPSVAVTPNVAVTPTVAVTPVLSVTPAIAASSLRLGHGDEHRQPYAMVRAGEDGMMLSGDLDDMADVRRARQHVHGDFLWFRHEGGDYVVQDPALLARARQAWGQAEAQGAKMQALADQMQPHSKRMEELGRKMEALGQRSEPFGAEMEALGRRMEPLARQQEALAGKMEKLARQHAADGAAASVEASMQQLQAKMQGLSAQMETLSRAMAEKGALMQRVQAPMEQLGREMEAAGKPMEALGRKLEVLGKQQETLTRAADAEVRRLIEDALRQGKAVPTREISR